MLTPALRIRLAAARRQLAEISDAPPNVSEIARGAGLSVGYFIRRFVAVFGDTPHQFRIRARMDWARRKLAISDRSVTEITLACGFSSLGSFSTLFAERVGMSPSEYRRRVRARSTEACRGALSPGCLDLMNEAWAMSEISPDDNFREARPDSFG